MRSVTKFSIQETKTNLNFSCELQMFKVRRLQKKVLFGALGVALLIKQFLHTHLRLNTDKYSNSFLLEKFSKF